jgi:hypothetical protein
VTTAGFVLFVALAGTVVDLDGSVASEARGATVLDDLAAAGVADVELRPALDLALTPPGLRFTARYAPAIRLQAATSRSSFFGTHRARSSLLFGDEVRWARVFASGSAMVGDVPTQELAEQLNNPFGLTRVGGTLPVADASVGVRVTARPRSRLRLLGEATARYLAAPDLLDPNLPSFPPSFGVLAPQLIEDGVLEPQQHFLERLHGEVDVTRRDAPGLTATAEQRLLSDGTFFLYGAPEATYRRLLGRGLELYARAGALVSQTYRSFPVAVLPLASVEVEKELRRTGLGRIELTASAQIDPFFDPFLIALTERFVLRAGVEWELTRQITISATGAELSRLTTVQLLPTAPPAGDDHILALAGRVDYRFDDNVAVYAGGATTTRIALLTNPPIFRQEVRGWVGVVAGYGLEL